MTPFRDLPIRRKVALLIIITSAIVVILTGAAFMAYEWATFRQAALNNVTTIARITAETSTAALRFRDEAELNAIVATLRAEPDITSAAIYDAGGVRVAHYHRAAAAPTTLPPEDVPIRGYKFSAGHVLVYVAILHDGRQLGTLLIASNLAAVQRRLLLYGAIVLLILVTSSLVAFALSSSLQARITQPIQELAKIAQVISAGGDYSTRATRGGNDELGALTDAFNRMLDEIKERDQRLSASEERLRMALSSAAMGTWRYYPDRHMSIVDENFRQMFGLPPGNSTATEDEILARIFPDDREPVRAAVQRALQDSAAQFVFDYRVLSSDGRLHWVRDRGRVVRRADGSVDYVTGAFVDITDRKEAEQEIKRLNSDLERRVHERTAELEQANRELEAFTYSVSHDLRGPLRHIAGYSEVVREDSGTQLSEDAQVALRRIESAAIRLSGLVDSLLDLSRVGRQPLVLQPTQLDELVDSALRELESETQNRRIEWHREPLPLVRCDPKLLHIVFVNLLSNALKYTRPREVAVITIGARVHHGRTAVMVRDNGVGFDPRFQDKLFGVFERLHSDAAFEGTGVGLATVDRIIRKHSGRIWAESEPERGAAFYFTLPGM